MSSADANVIDSYIRLMASPYLELFLLRVHHNDVNLPHRVLFIPDGLEDEKRSIWDDRPFVLNHLPVPLSEFENVRIGRFAKLTLEGFICESSCLAVCL